MYSLYNHEMSSSYKNVCLSSSIFCKLSYTYVYQMETLLFLYSTICRSITKYSALNFFCNSLIYIYIYTCNGDSSGKPSILLYTIIYGLIALSKFYEMSLGKKRTREVPHGKLHTRKPEHGNKRTREVPHRKLHTRKPEHGNKRPRKVPHGKLHTRKPEHGNKRPRKVPHGKMSTESCVLGNLSTKISA